ncbi:MAG: FHA domain-containing protein, partial [Candidatus Nanopelagicus sp.]|nr:FHA domain-containing protein [Candidatus Nanopelagicus sp.]
NLRQLRSIPQANQSDELYKSLSAEAQNVISNLPKGEGILLILKGAGIGARYLLDAAQTKLGRDMSNEIILDDITVSRSHALITKSNGYRLKDLGSLNGSYVNAVAVKESVINAGDEVQIGKYHLTLFIGDK